MAFIKEGINAFIGQPVERKRSDHRLKSVDSNIDPRSWALDSELRRQNFLNVVSQKGEGGAGDGREGAEEAKDGAPMRMVQGEGMDNYIDLFQDDITKLERERDFWKNVVADKENEIEQLLYRIHDITEDIQSSLDSSEIHPGQQKKLPERDRSQLGSMQNSMDRLQDNVDKMKEKLNEANDKVANLQKDFGPAQKEVSDPGNMDENDFLKNIIADKENEIERLLYTIREFAEDVEKELLESPGDNFENKYHTKKDDAKEIERLRSQAEDLNDKLGDANEKIIELQKELELAKKMESLVGEDDAKLNKIIYDLMKELDDVKASKMKDDETFKDIIMQKDHEIKTLKDLLTGEEMGEPITMDLPEITPRGLMNDAFVQNLLNNKNNEIKELEKRLENERKINEALRNKIDATPTEDINELKTKILELTSNLEEAIIETQEDPKNIMDKKPLKQEGEVNELKNKINQLENMLQRSEELNDKLNKDLDNERKKLTDLISADDNEIKKMLLDAEKEIEDLKNENEKLKKQTQGTGSISDQDGSKHIIDELRNLQEENKNLKNQNDSLKEKIENLQNMKDFPTSDEPEANNLTDNNLKYLQEENKKLKDRLANYEGGKPDEKESLRQQINDLKDELKSANDKNMQLNKDLESAKQHQQPAFLSKDDSELNKMLADTEKESQQLESDKDSDDKLLEKLNSVKSKLLSCENNNDKLTKENVNLTQEKDDLMKLVEDLKTQKVLPTSKDLQPDDGKLSDELKALQDENGKLKDSLANYEAGKHDENESLRQHIDNLKNELKTANDKNNQLQKDLELAKQQQQPAIVSENDSESTKILADAEKESQQLETDKDKLLETLNSLPKENSNLKKENEDLKKQIEDCKTKKDLSPSKETQPKDEKVLIELKALQEENKQLKDILANYEGEKAVTSSPISGESNTDKLEKENANIKRENDNLKKEIEDIRNLSPMTASKERSPEVQKLLDDLKVLQEENDKLKGSLAENKEEHDENERLRQQVDNLKNELKSVNDKNAQLQTDLELAQQQQQPALVSEKDGELKKKLADAEKEIQQLKSAKDNDDKLKEKLSSATSDLTSCEKNIDKLTKENLNLKQEKEDLLKQVQNFKVPEDLSASKGPQPDVDKLLNELKALQEENKKLKDNLANYEKERLDENEALKKNVDNLNNEIKDPQLDVDKLLNELKALQEENKKLKDSLANYEREKLDENEALKKKVESLNNELKAANDKNMQLLKELDSVKQKPSLASDNETELKKKLADAEKEMEQLKSDKNSDRKLIEELKAAAPEPVSGKDNVDKLTKENNNLKREIENLKKQIEDLNNLRDLSATVETKPEVEKMLDELKILKEENKLLKDNPENNNLKREIENLKKQIEDLNNRKDLSATTETKPEVEKMLDELKNLNEENKRLKDNPENNNLKREIENLKKQIEDLNNRKDLSATTETKPEVEKLLNELKNLKEENKRLKDNPENESLRQQVEKLKDDLKSARDKNTQLDKDLELAKQQLQTALMSGDNSDLKKALFEAEQKIQDLKAERDRDDKLIQDLKSEPPSSKPNKENKDLQVENESLKKQIEELKRFNILPGSSEPALLPERPLNVMQGLQTENSNLKAALESMKNEIESLRNQVPKLKEQLKNESDKNKDLKKDNELLNQQIKAFESGDESELNKIVSSLRNELDNIKAVKEADSQACKEAIAKKDLDIKHLKDLLNKKKDSEPVLPINVQKTSYDSSDAADLKTLLKEQDKKIRSLESKLQSEKEINDALRSRLNAIGGENESDSKLPSKLKKDKELKSVQKLKPSISPSGLDVQEEIDRLTSENNKLKYENSNLKKQIEDLKQRKSFDSRTSVQKLLNESHSLQAENIKLKDSLNKYESGFEDKIDHLQKEVEKLQIQNDKHFKDAETQKLNNILQKAIRTGLKSLYMEELEYVHDALSNTVAQRQGRPERNSGRRPSEVLELIVNAQEQRINSLMERLESYRQHNNNLEKTIMNYSNKVQGLTTSVGILELKIESLEHELARKTFLINHEQDKSLRLHDMLKNVLDNCKCSANWISHQNYRNISSK